MSPQIDAISDLPMVPAVYAMYDARGRSAYVPYVGIVNTLRARIEPHLIRRDSSVVTGISAACFNLYYIVEKEG